MLIISILKLWFQVKKLFDILNQVKNVKLLTVIKFYIFFKYKKLIFSNFFIIMLDIFWYFEYCLSQTFPTIYYIEIFYVF